MHLTADQFHKIRKVYRLTMADMGALLGISDTYINQIEKGKSRLTERVGQRLVDELQLTPAKLARILEIYDEFSMAKYGADINERE